MELFHFARGTTDLSRGDASPMMQRARDRNYASEVNESVRTRAHGIKPCPPRFLVGKIKDSKSFQVGNYIGRICQ